jgi:hypothetical protein
MVERTSRDSIPKPMVLTSIGSVLSADDGQHYGSTEKALGGATYADFGLSEPMYPENILSPFSGCEVFATGVDVVSDIAPKRLVRCKLHYSLNYGEFEVWTDTANVAEADKLRSKVDYEQSALAALENQEWLGTQTIARRIRKMNSARLAQFLYLLNKHGP